MINKIIAFNVIFFKTQMIEFLNVVLNINNTSSSQRKCMPTPASDNKNKEVKALQVYLSRSGNHGNKQIFKIIYFIIMNIERKHYRQQSSFPP